MTVGDTFLMQVRTTLQQRPITNNFGYQQTSGADRPSICQSLTRAFAADIMPLLQAVWSSDVGVQSIYGLSLNPPGRVPSEVSFVDQAGTDIADAYPADSAWVIRLVTQSIDSKNNGRQYMAGIAEVNVTNQSVNGTFLATIVQPLLNVLTADISDPDDTSVKFTLAVVNKVDAGVPVSPPTSSLIASAFVSPTMYTQRRRRTSKTGLAAT